MPFGLPGSWEWILILVVALLVFGKRLPEVMRSAGRSIVELKKGLREMEEEIERESSLPYEHQDGAQDEFSEESEDPIGMDDEGMSPDDEADVERADENGESDAVGEEEGGERSGDANTSPEGGKVSV